MSPFWRLLGKNLFPCLSQLPETACTPGSGPPIYLPATASLVFLTPHHSGSRPPSCLWHVRILIRILVIALGPAGESRNSLHLKILHLITFEKSLLSHKVLGVRTWTPLAVIVILLTPLPSAVPVCPSHDMQSRFLISLSSDIPRVLRNSKVNHRDNHDGSVPFSCVWEV